MPETMQSFILILISLFVSAAVYLFICFVLFRIGRKFGIGSFRKFCIPIYNGVLICRCGGISGWWLLGIIFPVIGIIFTIYLWGSVARRLGKNFWIYGLGILLLGLPVFILAFDGSKPVRAEEERIEGDPRNKPIQVDVRLQQPNEPRPGSQFFDNTSGDSPTKPFNTSNISGRFFVVSGDMAGHTIEVPQSGIIIGRDPLQANLVLTNDNASSRHASVYSDLHTKGRLVLEDFGSTNGTFYRVTEAMEWKRAYGAVSLSKGASFRIGQGIAQFKVV